MHSARATHKADRDLLLRLVDAISVSKTRLRRDPCGDWNIVGRRGHISTEGTDMYIYLSASTRRRWEAARLVEILRDWLRRADAIVCAYENRDRKRGCGLNIRHMENQQ